MNFWTSARLRLKNVQNLQELKFLIKLKSFGLLRFMGVQILKPLLSEQMLKKFAWLHLRIVLFLQKLKSRIVLKKSGNMRFIATIADALRVVVAVLPIQVERFVEVPRQVRFPAFEVDQVGVVFQILFPLAIPLEGLDAVVQVFPMGGERDCQRHQLIVARFVFGGCFGEPVREQVVNVRDLVPRGNRLRLGGATVRRSRTIRATDVPPVGNVVATALHDSTVFATKTGIQIARFSHRTPLQSVAVCLLKYPTRPA